MSGDGNNIKNATVSAGLSATDFKNDSYPSAVNNGISAVNSAFFNNPNVGKGTAVAAVLISAENFFNKPSAEGAIGFLQSTAGAISEFTDGKKSTLASHGLAGAIISYNAYKEMNRIVNNAKNDIETHKNKTDNAIDGNDNSNNPPSDSNNSDQSNNSSDNSPSEPYEPPPPPPKPTYKIEFDDGRPTTYTNNPFKDEYKGGKVSIIGFDDREYPVDPIPVDLNQPDWKKQVDEIAEKWRNGNHNKNKYYLYDPVVLDLDGDGIETLAHNKDQGAMFDFNADGLRNATGWVKSDDGILVFDRNNNDLVDNGAEVFGDSTVKTDGTTAQHGFDALSDLDDNRDGRIDALDTHFHDLKIWQDHNQDGISQTDELRSLISLEIQALNLNYQNTNQALNGGNILSQISSYVKTDGTVHQMGDVNFAFDTLYTEYSNKITESNYLWRLPNIAGSGRVRSLHEAMTLSPLLKQIVTQYSQVIGKNEQIKLLDTLLLEWAKTDPSFTTDIAPMQTAMMVAAGTEGAIALTPNQATIRDFSYLERIQQMYTEVAYKVGILDSFFGTKTETLWYVNEVEAEKTITLINTAYQQLSVAIYFALYGQTATFEHYSQDLVLLLDADEQGQYQITVDLSKIAERFKTLAESDTKSAFVDLVEYINHFKQINKLKTVHFEDLTNLIAHFIDHASDEALQDWINTLGSQSNSGHAILFATDKNEHLTGQMVFANKGNDYVTGTQQDDHLYGGLGHDELQGNNGNDYLDGGTDNDKLYGGHGQDILIGNIGNDYLSGGLDADTYIFSKGHGQDTIYEYDYNTINGQHHQDKLVFTDVNSDEVQVILDGSNLVLTGYHENDKVILQHFTSGKNYWIEKIQFTDKTLSLSELLAEKQIIATEKNDHLSFGSLTTSLNINAEDGNDYINTGYADDHLYGGSGNDDLLSGDGNDHLDGGTDNDRLYGGDGNDTLIGGTGNDYLHGGYDADTYIFSKGHGQDTISDYDYRTVNGQYYQDKLVFTDVNSDEVQIILDGSNLILTGYHENDKITLQNFDSGKSYWIEQFQFADKTLTMQELFNLTTAVYTGNEQNNYQSTTQWLGKLNAQLGDGNDRLNTAGQGNTVNVDAGNGNDYVSAGHADDTIYGGNGNDELSSNNGNDYLDGGADNDTLYGGDGADTLIGGTGNDHLSGGYDADTYIFSKGHGQDTISDYDYRTVNGQYHQDKIIFNDVNSDEVQIILDGSNLILTGYHENDKVILQHFTSGHSYWIEQFQFADKTLSLTELLAEKPITTTESRDHISLSSFSTTLNVDGASGNDYISTGSANDTLNGGNGNDELSAGSGNDYLNGGADNDKLFGGDGHDTLIGGLGQDTLYGGYGSDIAVLSLADLLEQHIDTFADFNLNQGDKVDLSALFEQKDTVLANLNDYLSLEKTSQGQALNIDLDGAGDQYQSQTAIYLNDTQLKELDQLIQAQAIIL